MSETVPANQRELEILISVSLKRLTDEQKTKLGDRRWFEREAAIHEVAVELAQTLSRHYEIRSRPTKWQGPSMISEGM
ncbi:MAG: hypothetical protein KDJ69_10025 [Nitratireductor sp.]|nr:hypothetical protein [Nitratireductor sp.]